MAKKPDEKNKEKADKRRQTIERKEQQERDEKIREKNLAVEKEKAELNSAHDIKMQAMMNEVEVSDGVTVKITVSNRAISELSYALTKAEKSDKKQQMPSVINIPESVVQTAVESIGAELINRVMDDLRTYLDEAFKTLNLMEPEVDNTGTGGKPT